MNRLLTIQDRIVKGRTYRFMYRVRNQIGWSEYSPMTYILAANVPEKPPQPVYEESTSSSIKLSFSPSSDNGGSIITDYDLEMSTDGNTFTSAGTFPAPLETHTLTTLADGLVAG